MFAEAARVTGRILLFRAGPQDFPYSSALTQTIIPLALAVDFVQYRSVQGLATLSALVHAMAGMAALAGFIYLVLHARRLLNRLQQTVNALFLASTVQTILLLAPLNAIAPHMQRIAQDPDLAQTDPVPAGPALLVMVLGLWSFMVAAHVFRHALGTSLPVGAAVALLAVFVTVPITSALGALLGN